MLDAATQRVDRLETAHVQHGNKEASLKDKVGPLHYCSIERIFSMLQQDRLAGLSGVNGTALDTSALLLHTVAHSL